MAKKRFQAEQIIGKLRGRGGDSKGQAIGQVVKKLGITEQTYYRWRKEYGGLRTDQAKRLKELEKDQSLDMEILNEAASGTYEPTKRRQAVEHVRSAVG